MASEFISKVETTISLLAIKDPDSPVKNVLQFRPWVESSVRNGSNDVAEASPSFVYFIAFKK